MKSSFKPGNVVKTHTDAVFQRTQQSLNGLVGTVVDSSDYYDIHVKLPGLGIVGFSEFELTLVKQPENKPNEHEKI